MTQPAIWKDFFSGALLLPKEKKVKHFFFFIGIKDIALHALNVSIFCLMNIIASWPSSRWASPGPPPPRTCRPRTGWAPRPTHSERDSAIMDHSSAWHTSYLQVLPSNLIYFNPLIVKPIP